MLNEEVSRYRELSGDTNPNVPISRIGGYLDGYEKALEQEPCEDCISRILNRMWNCRGKHTKSIDKVKMEQIIRDELPPVNPQPKTGRWIFDKTLDKHYYCSECKSMGVDYWDFCPYCGVKMSEIPTGSEREE